MVDVGSTANDLMNVFIPLAVTVSVIVTGLMHGLLNRTTSPRLRKLEQDVLKGSNDINNLANNVQQQQSTISTAVGVISSLSPGLSDVLDKHKDQVAAIEAKAESYEQKLQDLQNLIQQLQNGDNGDNSGGNQDSRAPTKVEVKPKAQDKSPVKQVQQK